MPTYTVMIYQNWVYFLAPDKTAASKLFHVWMIDYQSIANPAPLSTFGRGFITQTGNQWWMGASSMSQNHCAVGFGPNFVPKCRSTALDCPTKIYKEYLKAPRKCCWNYAHFGVLFHGRASSYTGGYLNDPFHPVVLGFLSFTFTFT